MKKILTKMELVQFFDLDLGLYLVSQKERDDIKYYWNLFNLYTYD